MEIEFNSSRLNPLTPLHGTPRREQAPAGDEVNLSHTEALHTALDRVPETRPEKVEHAKSVARSVKYPPDETIARIANLLAMHLGRPPE